MRNKTITIMAALAVIFGLLIMTSCGTDEIDISTYADEEIVLAGVSDQEDSEQEETVSIKQLKDLDCITKKTHSTSDKIGEVKATGPLLETLLEQYGIQLGDVKRAVFYGKDEYDVRLTGDYLQEHDIILAFGIDGQPLDEESAPVRVIIPESDSAYWIRMVNRIEIEQK